MSTCSQSFREDRSCLNETLTKALVVNTVILELNSIYVLKKIHQSSSQLMAAVTLNKNNDNSKVMT